MKTNSFLLSSTQYFSESSDNLMLLLGIFWERALGLLGNLGLWRGQMHLAYNFLQLENFVFFVL